MNHLMTFVAHHWVLVSLTVIVFFALMMEELRAKGALSGGVNPQEATQKINRDNALPLDIRNDEGFKSGHIVGSFHLPADQFDERIKKLNPHKHRPIIVVCNHGQSAGKYVPKLKEAGFEEVVVLSGGIHAWKKANMPVVKD